MIVWGGTNNGGNTEFNTGGRYCAGPTPTPCPECTPTPSPTPTLTPTPTPSCTPFGILYDQLDNASGNAINSQEFEAATSAFTDEAADDFMVPAGQTWTVLYVVVDGYYFNGAGPAPSFNVRFYNDSGSNLPGTLVFGGAQLGCTYQNNSGTFTIFLPASVTLSSGHKWVSVQARMD